MAIISNKDYGLKVLQYGGLEGNMAKLSKQILNGAGWDSYNALSSADKDHFWNLIWQAYLDEVKGPNFNIPRDVQRIVDYRTNPYGGQLRRVRYHRSTKPTNPKGLDKVKGYGTNPYFDRLPEVSEEYWKVNTTYYNNMAVDEKRIKLSFNSQEGIDRLLSEHFKAFDEEYRFQEYYLLCYIFNSLLSRNTLNTDQSRSIININENSQQEDITKFIMTLQNTAKILRKTPLATKYNEAGYETGVDTNDMILYVRSDLMTLIEDTVWTTAFNPEYLRDMKFEIEEMPVFENPTYVDPSDHTTPMVPVYSTNPADAGAVIGFNATGLETDPVFQPYDLEVKNNSNVVAVLMEKGTIFVSDNDAYRVESLYNPANSRTYFYGKQYNRTIGYDKTANFIKFVGEDPTP